ncbi:MAG: RNA polymerase sigma factor [Ferruginibacter sp.]
MNGGEIISSISATGENFTGIVNSRQRMVYNTALGIVQNAEDAEDVTQEVFIKVYEKLKDFRHEADLSTWIYRITVTTALDLEQQKSRQKRGGLLKRVFGMSEAEDTPQFDHPGVLLDKKEDAAVLFRAIRKLPTSQRVAFLLHKTEGLSNSEVAAVLEISLQAAESLQARARENLRKQLAEYYTKHYKQ